MKHENQKIETRGIRVLAGSSCLRSDPRSLDPGPETSGLNLFDFLVFYETTQGAETCGFHLLDFRVS